jgi:hypothetical protein
MVSWRDEGGVETLGRGQEGVEQKRGAQWLMAALSG